MKLSHWMTCAAFAALSLLAVPAVAQADTAGTLFEQPFFTSASALDGQDGWLNTGGHDAAIVTNTGSAAVAFGQQSLRISNARTSGAFGDQTFSAPLTDGAGEATSAAGGQAGGERQPHYDTTFRFLSTTPGAEQPGLAVTISPDTGNGGRMSFLRLRDTPAGIAIDFVDVPSALTDQGHVDFRETEVAQALARTGPHSVRLSIDFVPGESNDVVKVYVDDELRFTGSSWENYYRHDTENGPNNPVPVVDQLLLRVSSNPAHPELDGKGFLIDDVSSRSYGGPVGPVGPAGPTGPPGPAGPTSPVVIPGAVAPSGIAGAQGQQGQTGARGPATPTVKAVRVSILSARLNRNTGVAAVRLRCPASAGLCSGNISLTNGRGVRVQRMYDLSSLQSGTLRIRFATNRSTATLRKRASVQLAVFSRDQSGQAARVMRTLR
jgi:hypothetical protein